MRETITKQGLHRMENCKMIAIKMRTEGLINPIGIAAEDPVVSWNCQGGQKQTAYQIRAEEDTGYLLWDSGKVKSGAMRHRWGGSPLLPKTKVIWKVRLWDENDTVGEWEKATFETGIQTWSAKWIAGDYSVNKKERYPVDCFRKVFHAAGVNKARLYITACGLYEAKINGRRAGDFIRAPGITDYRKRVQYQTYDVTDLLQDGENTLTVQLSDGWYRGSCGAWGLKNQYGTKTKLLAQLELMHNDGSVQTVCSDESWDWSSDGPIRFADNKDGEIVDAQKNPSYSGRAKVTNHPVTHTASNNVPVTEHERLKAKLITTPSGKTVLDFGQNIAGYAEFTVNAHAGEKIRLRFGELLDENGEFTQKNIQCSTKKITTPLQQVIYTCKEGKNHYKTTFALFGFQYILVESDVAFRAENFTAIAVSSDMERTGWFESSSALLDKFVENTVWSAKNNHADLPTDCPTRERHGWTGDAQIFFNTAAYFFDYAPFAKKYMRDMYDWQKKDGKLPQIVPYGGVDFYMASMDGSVGWADAGVLIPYRFWKIYGDDSLIRRHYDGMAKYAKFMISRCGKFTPLRHHLPLRGEAKKYIVNYGQSYGEWAEPADVFPNDWKNTVLPHPEESTAYTVFVMEHMIEIAAYLGMHRDQALFEKYRDGCTKAYRELITLPGYSLDTDRQAKLVRPLYMHLLDEKQEAYAKNRLVHAMENYRWRLGTGFLSTPFILDVLADINIEYAYRLLENEEMPGWLFMPKNGATTIWESWEGTKAQGGIASLNHYSKGAVCEWLFRTMCGIHVDGENHFVIAPRPGGHFTHASAVYDSVYGRVESGWEKTGAGYAFTIRIPSNTTAKIELPDGRCKQVPAGDYFFTGEDSHGTE